MANSKSIYRRQSKSRERQHLATYLYNNSRRARKRTLGSFSSIENVRSTHLIDLMRCCVAIRIEASKSWYTIGGLETAAEPKKIPGVIVKTAANKTKAFWK